MAVKTLPGDADVAAFLAAVPQERRRRDAERVVALAREVAGEEPRLWGTSIVGFGRYAYRYASGHEGETARIGLAPRSTALVLYGLQDAPEAPPLLARLGGSTLGKGCVYVKDLAKVDLDVLRRLLALAWTTERPSAVPEAGVAAADREASGGVRGERIGPVDQGGRR